MGDCWSVQTRVPLQQQQLLFNGREMRNNEKLSSLGVKDEDLVMLVSNATSRYVSRASWIHLKLQGRKTQFHTFSGYVY